MQNNIETYQHAHGYVRFHEEDGAQVTQSLDQNALARSIFPFSQPAYVPTSTLQSLDVEFVLQTNGETMQRSEELTGPEEVLINSLRISFRSLKPNLRQAMCL